MNKGAKLIEKLKGIKHIEIIIAIIALAIMLGIYFYSSGGDNKNKETSVAATDYCTKMQSEIEQLISSIKGVGKTKVVISWESSSENVLAQNYSNSGGNVSSYPQLTTGSGSTAPIVVQEIYPKAISAVIVCQGGENASIKVNIIMAVSKLLNISTDNVIVYAMNK